MTSPTRLVAALTTTVLVATGASACTAAKGASAGGSFADLPASQILATAQESMLGLESVRVTGHARERDGLLQVDLVMGTSGRCSGTLAMDGGGGSFEMLGAGGRVWFKADERFWREQIGDDGTGRSVVGDRWMRVPADDDMRQFCHLDRFMAAMFRGESLVDGGFRMERGAVSMIGDVEVVALRQESGLSQAHAYVETADPHRLVRVVVSGAETSDLVFEEFDEPVRIRPPDPAEVADLGPYDGLDAV